MASVTVALLLSFFVAGLGIVYVGDASLGIGLILLWLMLCLIAVYSVGLISSAVALIAVIIWAYSMITTFFASMASD